MALKPLASEGEMKPILQAFLNACCFDFESRTTMNLANILEGILILIFA